MELPSRSWKITKYARFIPDKSTSFVRTGGPPAGSWRQYGDKEIRLLLVSDQQLIVQSGADILESLCLWNARSWLNCLAKGDSLAFVSKKEVVATVLTVYVYAYQFLTTGDSKKIQSSVFY